MKWDRHELTLVWTTTTSCLKSTHKDRAWQCRGWKNTPLESEMQHRSKYPRTAELFLCHTSFFLTGTKDTSNVWSHMATMASWGMQAAERSGKGRVSLSPHSLSQRNDQTQETPTYFSWFSSLPFKSSCRNMGLQFVSFMLSFCPS